MLTVMPQIGYRHRMSAYILRPRSCIADPELARAATVELPTGFAYRTPTTPQDVLKTAARVAAAIPALRRPVEPERMIVMTLAPVPARTQR
jgi:hypothetical protein